MKTKTKLLQRYAIVRTIIVMILTIASVYTISITYEPVQNLYAQGDTTGDSTGGDNPTPNSPADVSGMFNERGYYKSNSVSYDENEIISDFNGNLMYSFPMYKFKGPGDLYFDLSLNYNGSVNYQIAAVYPSQASGPPPFPVYNLTAPGWVFSLNGMAVQMLNFESNFFTQPSPSSNEVVNNDVKMLATGYQITNRLKPATGSDLDVLMIMMGDGSVVNLKRIQPNGTDCGNSTHNEDCYVGEYYTTSKRSYIRAKVEYIENQGWPSYRNRRVYLMKGDGLTYIYNEHKNEYYDFPLNTGNEYLKPQVLLLTAIKDRFGHTLVLSYNRSIKGRPLLTRIFAATAPVDGPWAGNTNFIYSPTQNAIAVNNTIKGSIYKIMCDGFSLDSGGLHRASVTKIINPYNDEVNITYERYSRTGNYVDNPMFPGGYTTLKLDASVSQTGGLSRISNVTNYNGGKREYIYLGSTSLSIDMTPDDPPGYKVMSSEYYGQGRDVFFTNMLSQKITKDNNTNIKTENFSYGYYQNRTDWRTQPIHEDDNYTATRVVSAAVSELNNNSVTTQSIHRLYKNFKIYTFPLYGENPDWDGETKLVRELFYNTDTNNAFRIVSYDFEKGTQPGGGYNGSFFDTAVTEIVKGITKKQSFRYSFESGPSNISGNNPFTQKIEIDPLLRKTVTDFKSYYKPIKFYILGHFYTFDNFNHTIDSSYFYQINLPYESKIYDSSGMLLRKETKQYIDTLSSQGYIGQLISSKVYAEGNSTSFLETQYKYNRNDTTGVYLFTDRSYMISNEGLLKETIDPSGLSTKYYYRAAKFSENDPVIPGTTVSGIVTPPKVKYKKAFENGSIETVNRLWQDIRLPVRVDTYVSPTKYSSKYMMYDLSGQIAESFDDNGFISVFQYDKLDRIQKAIVPFDFSTNALTDSTTYDTAYIPVDYRVASNRWGKKNDNTITLYEANSSINGNFKIDKQLAGGNNDDPTDFNILAAIRFPDDKFINLDTVFYATLEFWTYHCYHNIGGDTSSSEYKFQIRPLKTLNESGSSWEYGNGYGSFENINAYYNILSPPEKEWAELRYFYSAGHNIFDITSILNQNLGNDFKGLTFDILPRETQGDPPSVRAKMDLTAWMQSTENLWRDNFAPVIHIQGIQKVITPRIIKRYSGSTLQYTYDDANNKVTVAQKLEGQYPNYRYKQTEYTFDGFYRLAKTKQFNNLTPNSPDTSVSHILYNFLDQKAKTVDAVGNITKFSYDTLGYLRQIENADQSSSFNVFGYTNSLGNYFGTTYNGFVEIRQYKDETGRDFYKYFDAVGNLLRELKYVQGNGNGGVHEGDNPHNPDTTIQGDNPPDLIPLVTDYYYDALYRLLTVKTPSGKYIQYWYDAYGRQSQRTTPDAGMTKYSYDKNGNLILSQDANQKAVAYNLFTARTYDGLNRLLTISDYKDGNIAPPGGTGLGDTTLPMEFDFPSSADSLYMINAYDSLDLSAFNTLFNSNKPYDFYGSKANNTDGMLVATAFRTNLTDSWSFKFYRYDARGRVIRFWQKLAGMDSVKSVEYRYNSLNQAENVSYQPGRGDWKFFKFMYDDEARIDKAGLWLYNGSPGIGTGNDSFSVPDEELVGDGISGWNFQPFAEYRYNKNQQVDSLVVNAGISPYVSRYLYNNRNWLQVFFSPGSNNDILTYTLEYNKNGNIKASHTDGLYNDNFSSNAQLELSYIYDNSNRLVKVDKDTVNNTFDLVMNYDMDGNMTKMKRYGSQNNLADDYTYEYFSGKNRLKKVSGSVDQYAYDANGNVIADSLKQNYQIKYDWRNLITELRHWKAAPGGGDNGPGSEAGGEVEKWVYKTNYWYDEAGNRICKKTSQWYVNNEPDPVQEFSEIVEDGDNPTGYWQIIETVYYVRDADGKEIAIYSGNSIDQWNLYGSDNVGNIKSNGDKFFYLKDHLGTIRVVLDSINSVVSANDYDAWGFPLENRSFTSGSIDQKYQFTGKERDKESGLGMNDGYDYFGARYYDSRIGRWGQVEPLLDKYVSYSPYVYAINNGVIFSDINGFKAKISGYNTGDVFDYLSSETSLDMEMNKEGILSTRKLSNDEYYGLEQSDRLLYDAITNSDKMVNLVSLENPIFEENRLFIGGAEGKIDGNEVVHYINLESAGQMGQLGIYTVGETIIHEMLEGWLRISQDMKQSDAHKKITKMIPYGYGVKTLPVGITEGGQVYMNISKLSKNSVVFYEYDKTSKTFQWIDVLNQLEEKQK